MRNTCLPNTVLVSTRCATRATTAASHTGTGMPSHTPCPRNRNALGNPLIVDPVVRPRARPLAIAMLPNVTTNDGIRVKAKTEPLNRPTNAPATIANGRASTGFSPASTISRPVLTETRATTEPTDRSI